jgi:hypothetical protein
LLGKLCRLAKHCGQYFGDPSTQLPESACKNETQGRGIDEVYIKGGRQADSLPRNNARGAVLRHFNIHEALRWSQL